MAAHKLEKKICCGVSDLRTGIISIQMHITVHYMCGNKCFIAASPVLIYVNFSACHNLLPSPMFPHCIHVGKNVTDETIIS